MGKLLTKTEFRDRLKKYADKDFHMRQELESVNWEFHRLTPPKQERILNKIGVRKITRYETKL